MTFKEWLVDQCEKRSKADKSNFRHFLFEDLKLADGMSLSVQASYAHCCNPKEILDNGEYDSVEVYSHGEFIEEIKGYYSEMFTYHYVPVDIMEELVKKHGGIV